MLADRLYAGHHQNTSFLSRTQRLMLVADRTTEDTIDAHVTHGVRGVHFSMQHDNGVNALPVVHIAMDTALLSYEDTNGDNVKIVTEDETGVIDKDGNRPSTAGIHYKVSPELLKDMIDGGFYEKPAAYQKALAGVLMNEQFSSNIQLNVRTHHLHDGMGESRAIRVVQEAEPLMQLSEESEGTNLPFILDNAARYIAQTYAEDQMMALRDLGVQAEALESDGETVAFAKDEVLSLPRAEQTTYEAVVAAAREEEEEAREFGEVEENLNDISWERNETLALDAEQARPVFETRKAIQEEIKKEEEAKRSSRDIMREIMEQDREAEFQIQKAQKTARSQKTKDKSDDLSL